jgi:hypothetical protein
MLRHAQKGWVRVKHSVHECVAATQKDRRLPNPAPLLSLSVLRLLLPLLLPGAEEGAYVHPPDPANRAAGPLRRRRLLRRRCFRLSTLRWWGALLSDAVSAAADPCALLSWGRRGLQRHGAKPNARLPQARPAAIWPLPIRALIAVAAGAVGPCLAAALLVAAAAGVCFVGPRHAALLRLAPAVQLSPRCLHLCGMGGRP